LKTINPSENVKFEKQEQKVRHQKRYTIDEKFFSYLHLDLRHLKRAKSDIGKDLSGSGSSGPQSKLSRLALEILFSNLVCVEILNSTKKIRHTTAMQTSNDE
tara:strand:- start:1773 stop:2078 length:306 start_codon:yes stop_codon:yes gene_type:complete